MDGRLMPESTRVTSHDVARLAKVKNIVAVKEASGDLDQVAAVAVDVVLGPDAFAHVDHALLQHLDLRRMEEPLNLLRRLRVLTGRPPGAPGFFRP